MTMTPDWSSLSASRAAAERCRDDIAALKSACTASHPSHAHIVQCPHCYPLLVDRLRERYLGPPPPADPRPAEEEWFSSRAGFLAELDALFARCRAYDGVDLPAVDARVAAERRRWYLERVRGTPAVRRALEDLLGGRDLVRRVATAGGALEAEDDPAAALEALEAELRAALRKGGGGDRDMAPFLTRLAATRPEDGPARGDILRDALFASGAGAPVPDASRAYLERLLAAPGGPASPSALDDLVGRVLSDRQAALAARDQKEKHSVRLGELRRARTAHEAEKARKKGRRGAQAAAAAAPGSEGAGASAAAAAAGPASAAPASAAGGQPRPPVPEWMYDMAACDACGKTPAPRDFVVCGLCLVLAGLKVRDDKTVFCSVACKDQGLDSHIAKAHKCASGAACIQQQQQQQQHRRNGTGTGTGAAAAAAAADAPEPYLCKDCVKELRRADAAVFCSLPCAEASFARHRAGLHPSSPGRQKRRVSGGGGPAAGAGAGAGEAEAKTGGGGGAAASRGGGGGAGGGGGGGDGAMTPAEVRSHVVAVREAMRQFQARIGVEGVLMED